MADKHTKTPHDSQAIINEALQLTGDSKELSSFYQRWSEHYNDDVAREGYCGPQVSVDLFTKLYQQTNADSDQSNSLILDAGCGTGLLGLALKQKGFTSVDGCDLSSAMVDIAQQTNAYQSLSGGVDLSELSVFKDKTYDGVISCGVFTDGHVPPQALLELIRISKQNALIVISTRESYLAKTDFLSWVKQLITSGKINQLHQEKAPYLTNKNVYYWGFLVC